MRLTTDMYKLLTSKLEGKWPQEKKNGDPTPKLVTYVRSNDTTEDCHSH